MMKPTNGSTVISPMPKRCIWGSYRGNGARGAVTLRRAVQPDAPKGIGLASTEDATTEPSIAI